MKLIHKISPVLILLGYFYILYEGYYLCQFGGVRYHGQKMVVGAAVMAVGFLIWLITRKKAKEQQAGKKQYLWIAELVAAGAATIICGAAVIHTAIPYNGALSWKIDEWRRIIDESSSKDNIGTNKEENNPAASSEPETETETKTSENIRNSDTWEFNAEDGDMYYFINDITGYRLNVVDAACGSRFYNFEKTKDGGETFERLELPLDTVTELPSEAEELGFTIEDYDYHTMPQIVDGKMEIYLQTDAMEQQGIIFQSADNGVTWEYAGCKE